MARTTTSIASALSGDLLDAFQDQKREVRDFVRGHAEAEARTRLLRAFRQAFTTAYGLDEPAAAALARLATEMPPPDPSSPKVLALTERLALARAVAQVGQAASLRPRLEAASRGAREAFRLDRTNVLDFEDPEATGRYVPGLPPLHSQDSDISKAAGSDLFERGRDT